MARAFRRFCVASETPVRLNREPHFLLIGGGYLHLPVACMAINMDVLHCMVSVSPAHKFRNKFPILFSQFFRARPPHLLPGQT